MNTVATSSKPLCEVKVNLAWGKNSTLLYPETDLSAIVPKDCTDENIIIEQDVPESVDAPLDKGSVVGKATIYYKADATAKSRSLPRLMLLQAKRLNAAEFSMCSTSSAQYSSPIGLS